MVVGSCRQCGRLVEMTTEEAYTPIWCCSETDRLCEACYKLILEMREKVKER